MHTTRSFPHLHIPSSSKFKLVDASAALPRPMSSTCSTVTRDRRGLVSNNLHCPVRLDTVVSTIVPRRLPPKLGAEAAEAMKHTSSQRRMIVEISDAISIKRGFCSVALTFRSMSCHVSHGHGARRALTTDCRLSTVAATCVQASRYDSSLLTPLNIGTPTRPYLRGYVPGAQPRQRWATAKSTSHRSRWR